MLHNEYVITGKLKKALIYFETALINANTMRAQDKKFNLRLNTRVHPLCIVNGYNNTAELEQPYRHMINANTYEVFSSDTDDDQDQYCINVDSAQRADLLRKGRTIKTVSINYIRDRHVYSQNRSNYKGDPKINGSRPQYGQHSTYRKGNDNFGSRFCSITKVF